MTVTERVAYLKGLFEGLEIDSDKKEGKLLKGMLDALEDMATHITDLEQQNAEMSDELDDVYEELSSFEEELYSDEADDSEEPDLDSEEDLYQVVCPTCSETLYIDEDTLDEGSIQCPACGEELEFDLSALYDEDLNIEPAEETIEDS